MTRSVRFRRLAPGAALLLTAVASGAASACPGAIERALDDAIDKQEREIARARHRAAQSERRSIPEGIKAEGLPAEFLAELVERFDLEPQTKDRPRTRSCEDE